MAASMHGMPHGGDGIPNNGFSGHFCIHFLGSSTHVSGSVDPEHQLMVRKAAGKIGEYLDNASPFDIVDTFLLALNHKESQIIKMSFTHAKHNQIEYFLQEKDRITGIKKKSNYDKKDTSGLLTLDIPIESSIYRKGQHEERITITFKMKRTSVKEPWKIDFIEMIS
ncbi:hypothetical protein [Paenibacillus agricola]|uniref:Uncharacterized protein n=1 Tax=Paenibacillus agricola TaxID=2716264 RepID=A0ABX0JGG6_9BACL|nr:hypothetical protein [Paenibacillus agricola]NHN35018.1 hypothetical protein [Paenibacillus agricola]